jgi:hypothetical protein
MMELYRGMWQRLSRKLNLYFFIMNAGRIDVYIISTRSNDLTYFFRILLCLEMELGAAEIHGYA